MAIRNLVLASAFGAAAIAAPGVAAADFPSDNPIRLISPYGAGGAVDIAGRILSSVSGEFLDTRVDVISLSGAGGQEAIEFVSSAEPDGYTLLITDYGPLVTTALREDVSYELDDWIPLVQITEVAPIFFARADSAYTSLEAWIEAAKAAPDTISVGHGRHLSVPHLPLILLEAEADFSTIHLPTTGGSQALAFVLGGQVDIGASVPSTIQGGVDDGSLVALAVATAERVAAMPDVPTLRELGYDVVLPAWYTIFAHRDVPEDRRAILEERILAALGSESALALGTRTGTDVQPLGAEASMTAYQTTIENLTAILDQIDE
ncbi:MAG: tripartite tricarboxylate transporter substrate binding protein [Pararhodobacter sp.]